MRKNKSKQMKEKEKKKVKMIDSPQSKVYSPR
jgi:hypothetical protein